MHDREAMIKQTAEIYAHGIYILCHRQSVMCHRQSVMCHRQSVMCHRQSVMRSMGGVNSMWEDGSCRKSFSGVRKSSDTNI